MDPGTAGGIGAAIGVPLVFALLRRIIPARPRQHLSGLSSEELKARYRKWEVLSGIAYLPFAALLALPWFLGLRLVADRIRPASPGLIAPDPSFWALPAMFLGMVTAAAPLTSLLRLLLGRRYAEYEEYGRRKWGVEGTAAFLLIVSVVIVGCAVAVAFGLMTYTRFDTDGIVIQHCCSFRESRYAYAAVTAIKSVSHVRARNSNIVSKPHYVIEFADGRVWSTAMLRGLRDPRPSDRTLIDLAAMRSGRALQFMRLVSDSPTPLAPAIAVPTARPGLERVYAVTLGHFPSDVLDHLVADVEERVGLRIGILTRLALDPALIDRERRQVAGEDLLAVVRGAYRTVADDDRAVILAFVDVDMYVRANTWRFAFAFRDPHRRAAVISRVRMDPATFTTWRDPTRVYERLLKMTLRTLGALYFGHQISQDPASVMYGEIGGLDDLDRLGDRW